MGSVSRYLGQIATLMRDWPRVEVDFARAMRRNLESGARGEVAETRFDWGALCCAMALRATGNARPRCWRPLLEAQPSSGWSRSGAAPGCPCGAKVRTKSADKPRARGRRAAGRGPHQQRVATRLRFSVRTAENHVLNVMNKLGLDNRAQVAAWYARSRSTGEISKG